MVTFSWELRAFFDAASSSRAPTDVYSAITTISVANNPWLNFTITFVSLGQDVLRVTRKDTMVRDAAINAVSKLVIP